MNNIGDVIVEDNELKGWLDDFLFCRPPLNKR